MSLEDAFKIIREAEKSIQQLAASSMKIGDYDEAMKLTALAKSVSILKGEGTAITDSGNKPRSRAAYTKLPPKLGYPRFERDKDTLIRIGWHGTRNIEYKEKAPKELLDKIVGRSLKVSPDGKPFSAGGDFAVIKDKKGKPFDRNRVSVCLAWLRAEGLFLKEGFGPNTVYTIIDPKDLKETVKQRWETLPGR